MFDKIQQITKSEKVQAFKKAASFVMQKAVNITVVGFKKMRAAITPERVQSLKGASRFWKELGVAILVMSVIVFARKITHWDTEISTVAQADNSTKPTPILSNPSVPSSKTDEELKGADPKNQKSNSSQIRRSELPNSLADPNKKLGDSLRRLDQANARISSDAIWEAAKENWKKKGNPRADTWMLSDAVQTNGSHRAKDIFWDNPPDTIPCPDLIKASTMKNERLKLVATGRVTSIAPVNTSLAVIDIEAVSLPIKKKQSPPINIC